MSLSSTRTGLRAALVVVTLVVGIAAVTTDASAASTKCSRRAHVGRVVDSPFGPLRCTRVAAGRYRWRAVPVPAAVPVQPAAPLAQTAEPWVSEMLRSVNAERSAAGLAPLALCNRLGAQAQAHAADQAATGVMSHVGSDGSSLKDRAVRSGYLVGANGWAIGENVAYGYTEVGTVMTAWMNSAGHRANLLSGAYAHVGFGRASGATSLFWSQEFGAGGTC